MSTDERPLIVLVPGAWMGAWIWDATINRLDERGRDAVALTLAGLEPNRPSAEVAAIGLDEHIDQLIEFVEQQRPRAVVLVGHSYSGMVVGHVADQIPHLVQRSVHIWTFLPRDGRSLIDDWGPDDEARRAERHQIHHDSMLWAPPPAAALDQEVDLTDEQRQRLASKFVPHPGRTVLDAAQLSTPVTAQPITFIASAATGADPLDDLPAEFTGGTPTAWQLRTMNGGHWPMLTRPDTLVEHLVNATKMPSRVAEIAESGTDTPRADTSFAEHEPD